MVRLLLCVCVQFAEKTNYQRKLPNASRLVRKNLTTFHFHLKNRAELICVKKEGKKRKRMGVFSPNKSGLISHFRLLQASSGLVFAGLGYIAFKSWWSEPAEKQQDTHKQDS